MEYHPQCPTAPCGEVDLMIKDILCQVQEHGIARSSDDSQIRANEYPMLMRFLGRELNESSFALAPEDAVRVIQLCDLSSVYIRERPIVMADPHYNKPVPEPT